MVDIVVDSKDLTKRYVMYTLIYIYVYYKSITCMNKYTYVYIKQIRKVFGLRDSGKKFFSFNVDVNY